MGVVVARAPASPARRARQQEAIEFYMLVAPWVLGFVALTAGPMLYSLVLSFTDFDLFHAPRWVGLDNFEHLLTSPYPESIFWKSLGVTAYFTALSVPVNVVGSLALALLLNFKVRGVSFYRTIAYIPSLTPPVANALLWIWILNSRYGLANALLRSLGGPTPSWLTDPYLVVPVIVMMGLWGLGGNTMVIFLAGLQGVPVHLYEAAEIDGANRWQRLWAVTVPMISPTLFFNLILSTIASFQVFTSAYLMTSGGPEYATYFMVLYIYQQAFRALHMGVGSALAWILFVILMSFTLLQFVASRRWVYYEGESAR